MMQIFMIIICLLGLMRCFVFGKELSLREHWKSQIKVGLADGKHIVDLFSTEPRSKIFNQINLLTNFVGTIDSLAAFIQEYDPKTEKETFKKLKKAFTNINRKLELTSDKRFGQDFREIFFELRSIEFSFVIFNKFLEKLEELECTSQAECETGMLWTIKLFKNDFDIEDQYRHIFQATLNGTRFSKSSLLQQVKETSGCNEKTILKFGTNLLLKLFKAEQIMVMYGKLAKPNTNSISQIHKWTQDMYEFRRTLLGVIEKCSSKNVCKSRCNTGKCIHLSKENLDMCFCPNYFDGDNCQIHNQVILAKDTVAVISTLNQVPKVGGTIDFKLESNFLIASMKCISLAYEMIQKTSIKNIERHVLTTFDLGTFYNTYLSLNYLIEDARTSMKCDETVKTGYTKSKLMHTAFHLPRALYKINSYFNYRQSADTFQPESLLARFMGIHKNEACSKNFRAKIDNLWIQFHLAQANGFSVLMQVRYILNDYSPTVLKIFNQRTDQQIKFTTESTCSASIKHSADVHCDQFHLMKNMEIENKCIKGYARKGTRFIKCQNITSVCIPCTCNTKGAISTICNSETGQCQCKENFKGKNCDMDIDQDCKLSDWTTWSICSKSCGMGGEQKRYRHIIIQQRGHGKQCQADKVENRTCFKRCCNGAFECKDSSKCLMGIKCQPCNCDHAGSTSGKCQPINGVCTCKLDYFGRSCKEKETFIDCSAFKPKRETGIYKINPKHSEGFEVYCDFKTDKGGWTVFQRRLNGKTDFYRGWEAYKNGFGNLEAEFWLGNEKIHSLTKQGKYELRVDISDFNGNKAYAKYSTFIVGDASTNYKLTVAGYSGNADISHVKYKQFKREMKQMIVEVKERKATHNGNLDFNKFNKSKPEYKRRNEFENYTIPKKTRQEKTNEENISLPSIRKIISPISSLKSNENQERRIILAPKQLIVPPDPASYPPVLIPPPPPPPKSVSTSIYNETTITNENVIINDNFSEETADNHLNSCVISICPRQEEYNLQFTETEEYIIPDIPNEMLQPSYSPTPIHILLLRGLNEAQKKRITLNIGGTKFESCAQTLQNDPSSLLSRMLAPDSPFQPYIQEPLPSYFLDRDPRHFVHILNYLRSNCSSELSTFPRNIIHLRELQKEASFYKLEHLCTLLENRCLEILQGTVDRDIL